MSHVKYTGTSDYQIFEKSDFAKADVDDQGKVTFANGEPTEVSEAAADALTAKDGIFGDYGFEAVEVDEDGNEVDARGSSDEEDSDDEAPPKEVADSVDNPGSRADQTDTDTATGGGTTGGGTARTGGRGTTKKGTSRSTRST